VDFIGWYSVVGIALADKADIAELTIVAETIAKLNFLDFFLFNMVFRFGVINLKKKFTNGNFLENFFAIKFVFRYICKCVETKTRLSNNNHILSRLNNGCISKNSHLSYDYFNKKVKE